MKFGQKLKELDSRFPPAWQGHMLQYKLLESMLTNQAEPREEGDASRDFFDKLWSDVARINGVFVECAVSILHGHKGLSDVQSGCLCRTRPGKRIYLPNGEFVPASRDNILLYSRVCIEYAEMNALGLRKIIKKYDKHNKGDDGQKELAKLWRDQSGKSFLHSPMLVELTAVQTEVHESVVVNAGSIKERNIDDASYENSCDPLQTVANAQDGSWLQQLQCPICLDIPYKPICLACSHMFCKSCLFKASGHEKTLGETNNVLRCIGKDVQCPQCRQPDVFASAVVLKETSNLLKKRYPSYWAERHAEEQEHIRCLRKEYMKSRVVTMRKLRRFHPSYLLY